MTGSWDATFWLDDVPSSDHSVEGLSYLIHQYQGEYIPRVQAVLTALLNAVDSVEDVAYQMLSQRSIYTAIGAQLDVIGKIVLQDRGELSDEAYRVYLLARIYANLSDGLIEQFITILERIGITDTIQVYEWFPAAFRVVATGVDYPDPTGDIILDMKPAGVLIDFVYSSYDATDVFTTSSMVGTDENDPNMGTANLTLTTGGNLAGMYR